MDNDERMEPVETEMALWTWAQAVPTPEHEEGFASGHPRVWLKTRLVGLRWALLDQKNFKDHEIGALECPLSLVNLR